MSDRFKDFKPEIGGLTETPATASTRQPDTYADLPSLQNSIRELMSRIDAFQILLEKELTLTALPVGDYDPRLVEAHRAEWPEAAGPIPSAVSYRYYKALRFRETTTAAYIRAKYEEAARDVAGTPAIDFYQLSEIARDEALLVRNFLDTHIEGVHDQSEKRVLETLHSWVDVGIVHIKKMQNYYQSAASKKYLSDTQLERTSVSDARQGQAVYKVKMNSANNDIERDIDSIRRNFAEFGPVFYEKFLGPAIDFRLKVGRKNKPGTGDVNKDVITSAAYLGENLRNVIADQTRRETIYKTKMDKTLETIQRRDQYRSLITELSEKGKPIPTDGPRVLVPTEESPEEIVYWASDYSKKYNPDKPMGTQTVTSGVVSSYHSALQGLQDGNDHPQYLLRSGGHVTGSITFADGVRIDDVIPSEHAHTGEDGSVRISGHDIIPGTLDDDVVDPTKKPTAPFNLRITNYTQSIVPPGVTVIDATLTWDGDPELSHEVQITRI